MGAHSRISSARDGAERIRDSSTLVTLYADEPGFEEVRALDAIAISAIARVEVPAAIWRKRRIGELGQLSDAAAAHGFDLVPS